LANWIMSGAYFQGHLMVGTEINRLNVTSGSQIPEMDPMAVFVREKILRHDPVLELRRQPPLARHHVVAWQIPPEVIVQVLGTTIDLPASENIECLTVHDEHAGRPIGTILAAAPKGADVNTFRPAVDRVRSRVTGLFKNFLRLDDLVN